MLKSMRRMAGRLVRVLDRPSVFAMAGLALVSSAVSYASTSIHGVAVGNPVANGETVAHRAGRGGNFSGRYRRWRYGPGLRR